MTGRTAARPFAKLKIHELAGEFVGARNYRDVDLMRQIHAELAHRKSRRARAMYANVGLAIAAVEGALAIAVERAAA